MNIKTYDESDLRPRVEGSLKDGFTFEFIQDLVGDNPDIFGEHDNLTLTERLKEHGVFGKSDKPDPEMCVFYAYFVDLAAGKGFLRRLNKYIQDKAVKVQEAQEF